jgi:predicted O-linked N-acetylglucosamine transferase (SPINDLY family)
MSSQTQELLFSARQAFQEGRLTNSEQILLKLLAANPQNILAKELLAYVYAGQGDESRAQKILSEIVCDPEAPLSALYEYGALLLGISPQKAIEPLERAFKAAPQSFEVLHDLATAYACVGRKKDAVEKYDLAAQINPHSSRLFYNLGRLYDELLDSEKANACYRKALDLDPKFVKPRINLGLNLNQAGRFSEGLSMLEYALAIEPDVDFIFGNLLHAKMQLGLWRDRDTDLARILDGIENGRRIIHPFHFLSLVDDPLLQRKASEIYAKSRNPAKSNLEKFRVNKTSKIKVGYFSADFQNHPVTHLTAELFELHDSNLFEIYAFSSGVKSDDEPRQRLKKAFHEFIDITNLSDDEVVNLARSKGIDIAVDLGGYTEGARIGVFERRAAPVQVSYLGFLGTLGAPHMDYIFADHEIIPAQYEQFYAEKIVYLPNCFQINDRQRVIPDTKFERKKFGLPNHGFVFCSFNNSYKITPEVFASWCRILQRVEGSVLWLYEANKGIVENLQVEAVSRGLNPKRLVFSGTLPVPEYLARYRLADLFLDTFPYNAGTTASDALWAGLPVLTRSGKSFASRMAGSILKAIDASELITQTVSEYENLAVELALNRQKLALIKEKVAVNRTSTPLFNSPQTTKNIEKAYHLMHERYLAGLNPAAINIA